MRYQIFTNDQNVAEFWQTCLGAILERIGIQLSQEQIEALLGHLPVMKENFSESAEDFCLQLQRSGITIDWGFSGIALTSHGVRIEMGSLSKAGSLWIAIDVTSLEDIDALNFAAEVLHEMNKHLESTEVAQALGNVWSCIAFVRSRQPQ